MREIRKIYDIKHINAELRFQIGLFITLAKITRLISTNGPIRP
jgi:hypothetical protein